MEQREKKEKMDRSQLLPKTTSSAHSTLDKDTRHLKVAAVCDGNIQLPRAEQYIRKRSQVMKSFIPTNITSSPPIYHPIHPVREPLYIYQSSFTLPPSPETAPTNSASTTPDTNESSRA